MMENMDWKERAEKFLKSHLNDDNTNAEEAAVYFLSRGKRNENISKTINDAIERWRNDKTRWSEECRINPTRAASILRLTQWGEIGALQKYRNSIYQNFGVPYSQDFYPKDGYLGGYLSNTSAFFPLLFPLFTSDIAINKMGSKLTCSFHLWQNLLNDLLMREELFKHSIDKNKTLSQAHATLLSAYIFAAYRLGKVGIDQAILDKSVQLLMDSQNSSGLWSYDESAPDSEDDDLDGYCLGDFVNSRNHVILAAIGIHAIFLANPIGATRITEKAAEWLLKQQQPDGGWYQFGNPKYSNQVYTTVLVLDALELAGGGTQVTFEIVSQEKQATEKATTGTPINSQVHKIFPEKIELIIESQTLNDFLEVILNKKKETTGDQNLTLSKTEEKILEDPVNIEIVKIYQAVEVAKTGNVDTSTLSFVKMPTQEQIAEHLYKKKLTSEPLTRQAISKRVKRLKKTGVMGLDDDFHDEAEHHDPHNLADMSDKIKEKY